MKVTFRVASIEYTDGQTNLDLCMGDVGDGDVGMGISASLRLSGVEAIDVRIPRPGTLVMLTIEAVKRNPKGTP